MISKTFSCNFLSCILIDPDPSSTPLQTKSKRSALTFPGSVFRSS